MSDQSVPLRRPYARGPRRARTLTLTLATIWLLTIMMALGNHQLGGEQAVDIFGRSPRVVVLHVEACDHKAAVEHPVSRPFRHSRHQLSHLGLTSPPSLNRHESPPTVPAETVCGRNCSTRSGFPLRSAWELPASFLNNDRTPRTRLTVVQFGTGIDRRRSAFLRSDTLVRRNR